jgi:hypothetical protein
MLANQILYWFGIYLAVGLPVVVVLRLLGAIRTKLQPAGEMHRAIIADLRSKESRRVRWKRFAGIILMYPLILLIWPVVLVILILDMYFSSKDHWTPDPEAAFNCRRQHLVRVVAPEAAEAEAKVVDPLGRAPDLPFGHLNAGWHSLLADRQIGDSLWYFEVPGAKRGYALVQASKVRKEFVFEWD